jgi:hypothetical protein
MLVADGFLGDNDGVLLTLQSKLYWELIVDLYGSARERYLRSCDLVGVKTDLALIIEAEDRFDHRTLGATYSSIAAWFRFLQKDNRTRNLFETDDTYRDRLTGEWRKFFESEVRSLSADDRFVRAVLRATGIPNPNEVGCAAERELEGILMERYKRMRN